jgi:hypothetical protein
MMNYQVDESNDYEKFLAYNQAQGARMSAMEHLVPETMFSTEDNPAHGISAVKALQIAAAEGQRIWTITSENVDVAANNLTLPDDIISEIRNSAAAGMEITAHEQPVNFYGSSQVGYIILDPETGAGAYKIGGGENGGYIFGLHTALLIHLSLLFIGSVSVTGPAAVAALALLVVIITPIILIYANNIKLLIEKDEKTASCYLGGLSAGLEFYGIVGSIAGIDIKGKIISAVVGLIGLGTHVAGDSGPRECFE